MLTRGLHKALGGKTKRERMSRRGKIEMEKGRRGRRMREGGRRRRRGGGRRSRGGEGGE